MSQLPSDSALARELNPKFSIWATRMKTNAILADLYDVLAVINANLVAGMSKKKPKTPKRYSRPFDQGETRTLGTKDAMPRDDMHAWIEEKRAAYAQNQLKNDEIA